MERRLSTILAADLVGYSRLVAADEEGVITRLKSAYREILTPSVEEFDGRIFKTTGDGFLAEFASPVSATRCAVSIQRKMAEREARVVNAETLQFRIGIHIGDVLVDGDDLLGDGVNIAARLESIAPPAGIVISGVVKDHIKGRVGAAISRLGPQTVKNIPEPIDVWEVQVENTPVRRDAHHRIGNRASIAVLPFQNFSSDPDQDFLADGLVEDITTELSKFRWLFVIARNSTFLYKNTSKDMRKIAQELGVRYLVEGSVRRSGAQLRVTAQLIEADTATHLWAERWDRPLADLFAVQDELTRLIIAGVEPELGAYERGQALAKPTENLTAWELCHRGHALMLSFDGQAQAAAEKCLREAITYDPQFPQPYALLARQRYLLANISGLSADRVATVNEGLSFAQKALEIDHRHDLAHASMSLLQTMAGRTAEAKATAERGLSFNKNNALLHYARGFAAVRLLDSNTTISSADIAMKLSPNDPILWAFKTLLAAGLMDRGLPGDRETARDLLREAVAFERATFYPFVVAAELANLRGDSREARAILKIACTKFPMLSAEYLREMIWPIYENEPYKGYLAELIVQGLPEKSQIAQE